MKVMKKTVMVVMIVVCVIFLINKITFAGIEEILMPDAKVIVKGKLPDGCTVNIDLILNDSELNTSRIDDFVVWSQPIGVWNSCCDNSIRCDCTPYPPSLEILLAISENGLFFFGCEATLPDVLSVIGTISAGGGDGVTLNNWRYDDCRFESKDIALVGMGYKIFKDLEGKGYISEIYPIESFRDSYSIEVKHKFDKNAIVIYYPTYIYRGSEHTTIKNRNRSQMQQLH